MDKIGLDKVLHFVACFIIVAVAFLFLGAIPGNGFWAARLEALCIGVAVGVGKELYDKKHGGEFDLQDLAADGVGCLLALAFTFLM